VTIYLVTTVINFVDAHQTASCSAFLHQIPYRLFHDNSIGSKLKSNKEQIDKEHIIYFFTLPAFSTRSRIKNLYPGAPKVTPITAFFSPRSSYNPMHPHFCLPIAYISVL